MILNIVNVILIFLSNKANPSSKFNKMKNIWRFELVTELMVGLGIKEKDILHAPSFKSKRYQLINKQALSNGTAIFYKLLPEM